MSWKNEKLSGGSMAVELLPLLKTIKIYDLRLSSIIFSKIMPGNKSIMK
jgi:hypothetical protein